MAKKSSASSRLEKQTQVSAESIWNKPLTKRQKAVLDGVADRERRADTSQIDFSEVPALTGKLLTQLERPAKTLVAVRLDADVVAWLKQYGTGYSTRINTILRVVMAQQR